MRDLLAVIAGAVVGTGLRLAIDAVLAPADPAFPVATLLVNVGGSFALGVLVARWWPRATSWQRALMGTGLLGSFTTFSAFASGLVTLAVADSWVLALGYLAATLLGGGAAALAGLALGRRRPARDRAR